MEFNSETTMSHAHDFHTQGPPHFHAMKNDMGHSYGKSMVWNNGCTDYLVVNQKAMFVKKKKALSTLKIQFWFYKLKQVTPWV